LLSIDILLGTDERARLVAFLETRQHPQPDAVAHRQFHRPGLQHLGPERGQFQHLLERDRSSLRAFESLIRGSVV
jgi:hypothetical protein